jgi:hypothetical protein
VAWGVVQSKAASQGSGSSLALTLDSNVVVGDRLVVLVYVYGSGITLSQVTDSLGNGGAVGGKYDQALVQPDPFNGHLYWMTAPITTGGSCTITATASGTASFISLRVLERSGLSTATGSAAWDVTASNNGTISTSMASGTTGAVGAAGEMAVAAFGSTDLGNSLTVASPGAPWTERFNNSAASSGMIPMVVDDSTPGNGATVAATWTTGGTDAGNGWAAGVVVFKLASAGSTLSLAAAGSSSSSGSAAIGAIDPLTASGASSSAGAAGIAIVQLLPLAASGGSVSSGAAVLVALAALVASGGSTSAGAAALLLLGVLAASGGSQSAGSAAMTARILLAAAGASHSAGAASIDVPGSITPLRHTVASPRRGRVAVITTVQGQ